MRGLQIKSRTNRQTGVRTSRLLHRCGQRADSVKMPWKVIPQVGGAIVGGGSDKVNRKDQQHEGQWQRQPDLAAGGWRPLGGRGRGGELGHKENQVFKI